jgi:hypothetical protein
VIVARGKRSLSDAVPGLGFTPIAFTNPMFVNR